MGYISDGVRDKYGAVCWVNYAGTLSDPHHIAIETPVEISSAGFINISRFSRDI
jgi:hypothetical protein